MVLDAPDAPSLARVSAPVPCRSLPLLGRCIVITSEREARSQLRYLEDRGAEVRLVPVLRAGAAQRTSDLVDDLIARRIHAVTFTTSPAIRRLRASARNEGRLFELDAVFDDCVAAVAGFECVRTAEGVGWPRLAISPNGRVSGLLSALVDELV